MTRVILFFALFLFCNSTFSQTILSETYSLDRKAEYMLPSAESISKIKEVARPVGLYTGIPEIAIPVWSNEYCSYSINLKYYAAGIQVNEEASSVGLGWSIDAGGLIARVVRGLPDELDTDGYLNINAATKAEYNTDLDNYINSQSTSLYKIGKIYDISPDIFYYNFVGLKGKFFLNDDEIISIPHNNLKFEKKISTSGQIIGFTINTPDGKKYKFANTEIVNVNSGSAELGYSSYTSAWYLTSIGILESESVNYIYKENITEKDRKLYVYDYYNKDGTKITNTVSVNVTITYPRLDEIKDINSKAKFYYNNDGVLNKISISSIDPHFNTQTTSTPYNEFTKIAFTYGNFILDNGQTEINRTRKLTGITFGNYYKKSYNFTYNSTPIPSFSSNEQDIWGYYNDNNNHSLLPQLFYTNGDYEPIGFTTANISGANRAVNSDAIQAGMLETITNPNGGITTYTYEPQRFNYKSQNIFGGGLRIKDIEYSDINSEHPNKIISYNYTLFDALPAVHTGVLMSMPNFAYLLQHNLQTTYIKSTYRYADYSYGLNPAYSYPVFYKQVTIDYNGIGYSVNDFELALPENNLTNIFSNQLQSSIQLSTEFSVDNIYSAGMSFRGKNYKTYFCYDWNSAYLSEERNYDNSNALVNKSIYEYDNIESEIDLHGFYAGPGEYHYRQTSTDGDTGPMDPFPVTPTDPLPTEPVINNYYKRHKELHKFYYATAWKMLASKEDIFYEKGIAFSQITEYDYDNVTSNYRMPIEVRTLNASGLTQYSQTKYPYHYSFNDEVYSDVKVYIEGVEESLEQNSEYYEPVNGDYLLKKSIPDVYPLDVSTNLNFVGSERIAIEQLKARGNALQPIETVQGIILDDNTKQITSASLVTFKTINNSAVVPDKEYIIEGPIPDLSFTSSNFTVPQYQTTAIFNFDNNNYKLVKKYKTYTKKGELVEVEGLDGVNKSYKYSKYGSYLLAEGVNVPYKSYNGNGEPVRRPGQFIKTYAYKPLVGKKRITDDRGVNTYFVYDMDGNLVAIKDHDKNIREYFNTSLFGSSSYQKIDVTTDPDGNKLFLATEAIAKLYISKSVQCQSVNFQIIGFNPVFKYKIDYGDGESQYVNSSEIDHRYPDEQDYNVTLYVLKNGFVVNSVSGVVDRLTRKNIFTKLEYSDVLDNDKTYPDINYLTLKSLFIKLTLTQGSGNYTVIWSRRTPLGDPIVDAPVEVRCNGASHYSIYNNSIMSPYGVANGGYFIKCIISDSYGEEITKEWNVVIGNEVIVN